jgi:ubiquitin carboxyl-terminal hydrolase L3
LRTETDTDLGKLLSECESLDTKDRAGVLEKSRIILEAYPEAAQQGSTEAPDVEDDVLHHYVCYVPSDKGQVYLLDGERNGPMGCGVYQAGDEDIWRSGSQLVSDLIQKIGHNGLFTLLALVKNDEFKSAGYKSA